MSAREDFVPTDAMYYDEAWEVVCDEVDRLRAERDSERAEYEHVSAMLRDFGVTFERWRAQTYVALSNFLSVLPNLDELSPEPVAVTSLANNVSITQGDDGPDCRCGLDAPMRANFELASNGSLVTGAPPVLNGVSSGMATSTLERRWARTI